MFILNKIIRVNRSQEYACFLQIWNVKYIVDWKTKVCQALVPLHFNGKESVQEIKQHAIAMPQLLKDSQHH